MLSLTLAGFPGGGDRGLHGWQVGRPALLTGFVLLAHHTPAWLAIVLMSCTPCHSTAHTLWFSYHAYHTMAQHSLPCRAVPQHGLLWCSYHVLHTIAQHDMLWFS